MAEVATQAENQTQKAAEQEALGNILKSPEEGGAAQGAGVLGAGADVPGAFEESPATQQLVEEAILTQTGQSEAAQAVGAAAPSPTVTTAEPIEQEIDQAQTQIDDASEFFSGIVEEPVPEIQSTLQLETSGLTSGQEELFDRQQGLIDDTYDSQVESIRQATDQQIRAAEATQKQARGASRVQLARMGALNTTTASLTYLNSLAIAHNSEISSIRAAGEAAIAEAGRAKEAGELGTLGEKLAAIDRNREAIAIENQRFLDNTLKMSQIAQMQRETAMTTIDTMITAGVGIDDLPDGYLNTLDQEAGYVPGTSAGLWNVAQREQEQLSAEAEVEQLNSLVDLLQKIPQGEQITIGGSVYSGMKNNRDFVGTEIDKATGDITSIIFNEQTGNVEFIKQRGALTPNIDYEDVWLPNGDGTESLWKIPKNPAHGSAVPVMVNGSAGGAQGGAVNTNKLMEDFPDGESFSFYEDGSPRSWCLEWIREISNESILPPRGEMDTIKSKRTWADSAIGFGEGQNMPKAGDYILTNEDSQWGHIALIDSIRKDENGQIVAILAESNHTAGRVTYGRKLVLDASNMEENGGRIMGFHKSDLKEQYTAGRSDAPLGDPVTREVEMDELDFDTFRKVVNDIKDDDRVQKLTDLSGTFGSLDSLFTAAQSKGDEESLNALDTAMVIMFNKMLDPGSVVREGEFARTADGQSLINRASGFIEKLERGGGGITMEEREGMVEVADTLFGTSRNEVVEAIEGEFSSLIEVSPFELDQVLSASLPQSAIEFRETKLQQQNEINTLKQTLPGFEADIDALVALGLSSEEIRTLLGS